MEHVIDRDVPTEYMPAEARALILNPKQIYLFAFAMNKRTVKFQCTRQAGTARLKH